MKGGNEATNGSGITHSPTGELNVASIKTSREVRKVREVLKITLRSLRLKKYFRGDGTSVF